MDDDNHAADAQEHNGDIRGSRRIKRVNARRIVSLRFPDDVSVEDVAGDFESVKERIQASHAGFYRRQSAARDGVAGGKALSARALVGEAGVPRTHATAAPPQLRVLRRGERPRLRGPLFVAGADGTHVYPHEARRAGLASLVREDELTLADGVTVAGAALTTLLRDTPLVTVTWETDNVLARAPIESLCVCAREARTPVVVLRDFGGEKGPKPGLAAPALYLDIDDDSGSDPVDLFVGAFFDALVRWDTSEVRAALLSADGLELQPFLDTGGPDGQGWLVDVAKEIPKEALDKAVLAHVLCGDSTTLSDMDDLADILEIPLAFSRDIPHLGQGVFLFCQRGR